jgi:hypothetical protein
MSTSGHRIDRAETAAGIFRRIDELFDERALLAVIVKAARRDRRARQWLESRDPNGAHRRRLGLPLQ